MQYGYAGEFENRIERLLSIYEKQNDWEAIELLEIFGWPNDRAKNDCSRTELARYGCVGEYMNRTDGMPSERKGDVPSGVSSEARGLSEYILLFLQVWDGLFFWGFRPNSLLSRARIVTSFRLVHTLPHERS